MEEECVMITGRPKRGNKASPRKTLLERNDLELRNKEKQLQQKRVMLRLRLSLKVKSSTVTGQDWMASLPVLAQSR